MTDTIRASSPAPSVPRGVPPAPPPPPMSTQRQATQTLDMSAERSTRVAPPGAPPVPTAPPPVSAVAARPGTPAAAQGNARAQSNPSRLTMAQIIKEAYDKGFSDVHLGVGEVPRFRNRGEIEKTDYPVTDNETFMCWLREIMTEEEIRRFKEHLEFDGATQYDFARVRINVFDSMLGNAMVLRLIPLKILTMEQLRLPPIFRDVCHYHKGLILVTGPTGSGKSTTMAAMMDYMNHEMPRHIITIEDPIEFVHQSKKALIKQREVGMHTRKFDNALKAALREDPDVILVGEMRDKETVNTALKAAQTGHLVMGTLHTNSAVKTIERILNLYSAEEQDAMRVAVAESLVAVIAQGLCRTTDGKRAAFHDILINTDAVKEWIKDGKYDEISELMKQASFDGMITMNQALLNLYQEGRITEETALEMSPTPNEMAQFLRGRV
ncbi:twitching motility protein PilT [Dulcicalothrix desertica PCC 7102]|uniref:Twitching motility protein PilT n=1 Tax=Dulcicalothrix desertica PCC 7102 TaxID=232991 RepID=A0A3S1J8W9_9CYAN|nr:type IV pilus twitching motility protein PilT [Dulcicalothrix desertica]RUT09914.1 twitching motility protein PilT [Dulcicalothrix desertica PCC 7102]TWH51106.1 twitching motility protein PilT [Dulcicalothrix desertica PCC 7102]